MDIANQLFSLTLGVEPNKQTLQTLAGTLNSAGESAFSKFSKANLISLVGSPLPLRKTASSIAICGYGRGPEIYFAGTYSQSTAPTQPTANQIHRSCSYSTSRQSTQSEDSKRSSSMANIGKAIERASMEEETASASSEGGAGEEEASKVKEAASSQIRSVQGSSQKS